MKWACNWLKALTFAVELIEIVIRKLAKKE